MTPCDAVLDEIQQVFDTNGSLSVTAREHLDQCAACRGMLENYKYARRAVDTDIETTIHEMGAVDLSFTRKMSPELPKRERSAFVTYLPRAAAILAIVVIPILSYFTYNRLTLRNLIRGDTEAFISQLYEGVYFSSTSLSDEWDLSLFSATEGVEQFDITFSGSIDSTE